MLRGEFLNHHIFDQETSKAFLFYLVFVVCITNCPKSINTVSLERQTSANVSM